MRWSGHIWTSPPDNVAGAAELFRCRGATGDRWDSLDPNCLDGPAGTAERSLGFVVIEL